MSRKPGVTKVGPYIMMHTAGTTPEQELNIFRDSIRETKKEIARLSGIPWSVDLEVSTFFSAEKEAHSIFTEYKAYGISDGLKRLLSATRKKDAERLAGALVITKEALIGLKLNCEELGFKHRLFTKEFPPKDLKQLGEIPQKLTLSGQNTGEMSKEGKRYFKNVNRLFDQRKQIHVHLFENDTQYHFFYFDYSDVGGGHYKHGPHLHYSSHLWDIRKEETFRGFEDRGFRPTGTHIRIDFEESTHPLVKNKGRQKP